MKQNLQDIQEKIFSEAQNLLEILGKSSTKDQLLQNDQTILELYNRVSFLKILKNENLLNQNDLDLQTTELYASVGEPLPDAIENDLENHVTGSNNTSDADIFTNEIEENPHQQINDDEILTEKSNDELIIEDSQVENELPPEAVGDEFFEIDNEAKVSAADSYDDDEIHPTYEERVAQKEKDFLEMEERRRKIVEFSKHETPEKPQDSVEVQTRKETSSAEKKFKLANIKGIKAVKNLFDEDPLEKIEEEEANIKDTDSGSILKTNIATDFMEAVKKRQEFRIDFNDKIAFTKLLFNGNEAELKQAIEQLNTFDNLEDAKQFLSEIYYRKDWSKADEYAQRLWTLVENKFL